MKKLTILTLAASCLAIGLLSFELADSKQIIQYQWRQISVIESVVPAGVGRSRLISTDSNGKVEETKLANFFSVTGINFSNVRANDQAITDKITEITDQGWEYNDVTSGVYTDPEGGTGIFITRYMFRKPV